MRTYRTTRTTTVETEPSQPNRPKRKGMLDIFDDDKTNDLVGVDACVPRALARMFKALFDAQ